MPYLFLMYRVELKDRTEPVEVSFLVHVPNVPCGVERSLAHTQCLRVLIFRKVPNVPCGVES